MKVGMLWFDGDRALGVDDRIVKATDYYREKYGQKPTVCYVNPIMLLEKEGEMEFPGIDVKSNPSVLKDHFWLGTWDVSDNGTGSD